MVKSRLDQLVHAAGLAPSRERAQALILAGRILVNQQKVTKPGTRVDDSLPLRLVGDDPQYASRAGAKLAAALDHFAVAVEGRVALDIGSSTGGFTDCLLQRGAVRVHAVDSGTNQMEWRLRNDPRVHLLEQTNARFLTFDQIGEPAGILVMDVSFISVTLLLPAVAPILQPGADAVILVKPQFEAGRAAVGKGGIVRDDAARLAAVDRVMRAAAEIGLHHGSFIPCPVLGAEGNQEYLFHARVDSTASDSVA